MNQLGRKISAFVANGTHYWYVEKNLPSSVLPEQWVNLAWRWRQDKGIQLFFNGGLVEEIPFAQTKNVPDITASDNKLYVGCRKVDQSLKDFTDIEMDEFAIWRGYILDEKISWLVGSIIEPPAQTVFMYNEAIELVTPAPPVVDNIFNPYYEVADVYESCGDVTKFADAVTNIPRGHGKGVFLQNLTREVKISSAYGNLENLPDGLANSFWILTGVINREEILFESSTWKISVDSSNITVEAVYKTFEIVNGTTEYYTRKDTATVNMMFGKWVNYAFTLHQEYGVHVYINGIEKTGSAILKTAARENEVTAAADVMLKKTSQNITVSDIVVWKRFLYPFEAYRFMGMSPSELYLNQKADYYWTTDYYITLDQQVMGTWLPIYTVFNSSVKQIEYAGESQVSKGDALEIGSNNGWVMLALINQPADNMSSLTGTEFAGTCLSDPSKCGDGLTLALWLKLKPTPSNKQRYTIISSGEEDPLSRGFSITIYNKELQVALVDGKKYWKIVVPDGKYSVDEWMHLAFTWSGTDGLWVFMNGEVFGAVKNGIDQLRSFDRYTRITLGRSNANNNFGNFISFAIREIAVFLKFTVSYKLRESFSLPENKYYEQAQYFWNKNEIITSKLEILKNFTGARPYGSVRAHNNTISLGESATVKLDSYSTSDCVVNPKNCPKGITVSTWTRNNLFTSADDQQVKFILSSNESPEDILEGKTVGWTIYYIGNSWMATLVSNNLMWNVTLSELATPLIVMRWTNLGFTWSAETGMVLFMDGQVSAIMKRGIPVSATTEESSTLSIGHTNNNNHTFIDIFNVAIWGTYYFGSRAYEITGCEELQISKYSAANLMWTFDGPIHFMNQKFNEMHIPLVTYDDTLKGEAVKVTSDGLNAASLGNYSSECITQPSSCTAGFLLGLKLSLSDFTPGEGENERGSVLLLGSPDSNFEGIAIQQIKENGVNKLLILVTNDKYNWARTVTPVIGSWFDLIIGWNVRDGIAVKINNVKVAEGSETKTDLAAGSAKLITNMLLMGVGSGGPRSQPVEALYNDLYVTYNSKVTVEQEGRCYDTARLYYRLNKGQIFTMENVEYIKDRDNVADSAFLLSKNCFIDLDLFPNQCFSDPSLCDSGLSLSFYVRIDNVTTAATLLGTGGPAIRGYSAVISPDKASKASGILTVSINDGNYTWEVQVSVSIKTWINVAFTWNSSMLVVYIDGTAKGNSEGTPQSNPQKTARHALTIGRGNDYEDTDFCVAAFDDVAVWDRDISQEQQFNYTLLGKNCGQDEESILVEAVLPDVIETTTIGGFATLQPDNCKLYDKDLNICAKDPLDFLNQLTNLTQTENKPKLNNFVSVISQLKDDINENTINRTQTKDKLTTYKETLSTIKELPVDQDVDPRQVQTFLDALTEIGSALYNTNVFQGKWKDIDTNATKQTSSASLLNDIDELTIKLVSNVQLGMDVADDCTPVKSGASGILLSGEKRRAKLCDRNFTFPQYDIMTLDSNVNKSLQEFNRPTDSVVIDRSTWPLATMADDTIITVSVILYNEAEKTLPNNIKLDTFMDLEATTSADNPVPLKDKNLVLQSTINSRIMSITVDPPITPPLEKCVVITLEHKVRNKGNKRPAYCVFWDYEAENGNGGAWSGEGCEHRSTNETHTVCCCYHLTSFAVMMEPYIEPPVDYKTLHLRYIMFGGVGLSLLSLLIFFLIILCNKSLRSERSMVHLNLCISMIFATISYLLVEFARDIPVFCQAVAVAQHYFFIVAYCWIMVESICLFNAVLYGKLTGYMGCYSIFGWVAPGIIVGVFAAKELDLYGTNTHCWITYNHYFIFVMLAPILFSIACNLATVLIILCNLPQPNIKRTDILSEVRWAIVYILMFIPVHMFIWTVATLRVFKINLHEYYDYAYVALFSLQGFLCFLVYGLGQKSIRTAILRKKYGPPSSNVASTLISQTISHDSMNDSQYIDVKPQPLSRPSTRSSKDKSSPTPPESPTDSQTKLKPSRRSADRRRSSNASNPGYLP